MAHFDDLTPCTYFPGTADKLRAVGWLENGHPFPKGTTSAAFLARLKQLLVSPWAPIDFMGPHFCDLCPPGTRIGCVENLFVPTEDAVLVTPTLIEHYIEAHQYQPPELFIAAVMRCPEMNSPEYVAAINRRYRPFEPSP